MMTAQNATEGNLQACEDAARELFHYARQAAAEGTPIHVVERRLVELP